METPAILTAYFKAGIWGAGLIICLLSICVLYRLFKVLKLVIKEHLNDESS